MIIKSAGFIDSSLIRSQNNLNFAYILYLKLKEQGLESGLIEKLVKRWFAMSVLTSRYSYSPESMFDLDIRNINKIGAEKYLEEIESSDLTDAFWEIALPRNFEKSSTSAPEIDIFFASQSHANDEGFLSTDIKVSSMIEHRGDIHHIFPKDYLMKKYNSRSDYNQIANYVYAQQEINIKIGNKSPKQYFGELNTQIETGKLKYGNITTKDQLLKNLEKHCIPTETMEMEIDDYFGFLTLRRKLMAKKIEKYYKSL